VPLPRPNPARACRSLPQPALPAAGCGRLRQAAVARLPGNEGPCFESDPPSFSPPPSTHGPSVPVSQVQSVNEWYPIPRRRRGKKPPIHFSREKKAGRESAVSGDDDAPANRLPCFLSRFIYFPGETREKWMGAKLLLEEGLSIQVKEGTPVSCRVTRILVLNACFNSRCRRSRAWRSGCATQFRSRPDDAALAVALALRAHELTAVRIRSLNRHCLAPPPGR
jgi:hypothetical protein